MTLLEGGILCVILAAMLGARQPGRTAISIVLYVAIVSIILNKTFDLGWVSEHELSPLIGIFELLGAVSTIAFGIDLRKEDRVFFFTMAKFLLASGSLSFVASLEVVTITTYMVAAYSIVIAHLAYMLRHSDGVMDIFRGIRDYISGDNLNYTDSNEQQGRQG